MYILYGLGSVVALFALYVSTRPGAFRIVRSATIDAPPSKVFALINDFHEWAHWSPWEKMDGSMKKTYEGPAAGRGAVYRWSGDNKVGEGVMTMLESSPDSRLEIELAFLRPFQATNKAIFTLEPDGTSTRVTWAMEGNNAFVAKAFGVFMDMDQLVGRDFEKGLASMKDIAEKAA